MKSVGIITFHSAHNYGAMLQVYALQETIKNLKCDVKIINYRNNDIDDQYKGQDVTTVLGDTQDTVLLVSQDEQDNKNDIMLDITFIHTELVL